MTETEHGPEHFHDPELLAIGERFSALAAELGFEPTDAVRAARIALLRGVRAGRFDGSNPAHSDLYVAYQTAAEAAVQEDESPLAAIGYQIALAELWLMLDDPDRFYDKVYGETGAEEMLFRTPGGEAVRQQLINIVEDLEARNNGSE